MQNFQLILGSQSPRRKELLQRAGFKFQTLSVEVSEILDENLTLEEALQALALKKAKATIEELRSTPNILKSHNLIILSADTIVTVDGRVLGKPKSVEEAVSFLKLLSGRDHAVMTSVALIQFENGRQVTGYDSTKVWFRSLTDSEIRDYVATGEPMDKAGAYAIQGLAQAFVAKTEGEIDNVVGLPIRLVRQLLSKLGMA